MLTQKKDNIGSSQEKIEVIAATIYDMVVEQMEIMGFTNDNAICAIAHKTQIAFEEAVYEAKKS